MDLVARASLQTHFVLFYSHKEIKPGQELLHYSASERSPTVSPPVCLPNPPPCCLNPQFPVPYSSALPSPSPFCSSTALLVLPASSPPATPLTSSLLSSAAAAILNSQ
ncbi:hypothetical protein OIU84_013899 [Salix udensis]|uniref:Uncharacterized protein n=1 Tax=Salix udensis TaxID=889485 RepID=A0AAD6NQH4_9ROSI|nr:hypothetical protein OIU84_013899 [Salix udensis]